MSAVIGDARRVTWHEARRAFEAGASVLIDENGTESRRLVTVDTQTHSRESVTWQELAANVRMWRNRYPRQRFYLVEMTRQPPARERKRNPCCEHCQHLASLAAAGHDAPCQLCANHRAPRSLFDAEDQEALPLEASTLT